MVNKIKIFDKIVDDFCYSNSDGNLTHFDDA